eukprot:g13017.t1
MKVLTYMVGLIFLLIASCTSLKHEMLLKELKQRAERNDMKLNPQLMKLIASKSKAKANNKCPLTDKQNAVLTRHDYIKDRCLTWGNKSDPIYDGCVMLLSSTYLKHGMILQCKTRKEKKRTQHSWVLARIINYNDEENNQKTKFGMTKISWGYSFHKDFMDEVQEAGKALECLEREIKASTSFQKKIECFERYFTVKEFDSVTDSRRTFAEGCEPSPMGTAVHLLGCKIFDIIVQRRTSMGKGENAKNISKSLCPERTSRFVTAEEYDKFEAFDRALVAAYHQIEAIKTAAGAVVDKLKELGKKHKIVGKVSDWFNKLVKGRRRRRRRRLLQASQNEC